MITWLVDFPIAIGLISFALMFCDWFLTIAQEKERAEHYFKHYQSYPTNTIEGNPVLQQSVKRQTLINPKHFIAAALIGVATAMFIPMLHGELKYLALGYLWGIFLLVNTQHLSNLLGYRAGRRGIHGKLFLHQRTGLLTQSGRYFSTSLFLLILFALTGSLFMLGVTIAGFSSAARQFIWLRKIPPISGDDAPPYC